MKTVTVTLGGREYLVTDLTLGELCEIARLDAAMRAAGKERDIAKIGALLREALEIVCSSIRRTGSNVPTEEVKNETPVEDIRNAVQILLNFTNAPFDSDFPSGAKIQ
jgi:hypothetical protein